MSVREDEDAINEAEEEFGEGDADDVGVRAEATESTGHEDDIVIDDSAESEPELEPVDDSAESEPVDEVVEPEAEPVDEVVESEPELEPVDGVVEPDLVADPSDDARRRPGRWVILGVILVAVCWWGATNALEVKGELVEDTSLTPASYLDQAVTVDVDGVEHRYTLAELGWRTEATDSVTGAPFTRQRLHIPVEPEDGTEASPIVVAYRSELEREPTDPVIDAAWTVVEGVPGVRTEVAVDRASPPEQISVTTHPVDPAPSEPLERFVRQRDQYGEGWEIKLLGSNRSQLSSFTPEEVAAHVQFDRESATVKLVDETGLRALLAERIRPLTEGGERGRYELEAAGDGITPVITEGRFTVVDTMAEPVPGQVPDIDQAWADLVEALETFKRVVAVDLTDADDLYGGVDPADLTVKLAESRTPDTGGGRMTNIRAVLEQTRGIVIEPGGTFGINQTIGQRTTEGGFVLAGAIANGEHVEDVGGGVSQTATMFHQAAYLAGLTFPERVGGGEGGGHGTFGHSEYFSRYDNYHAEGWGLDGRMETGRLGRGVEQTVNWPNREAGFVNTTPYPILIWTFDTGDEVGVSLWSLERTRFGVYEGTDSWGRGSCIDWTHYRTVYDMDNNALFEDSYHGYYRTAGPSC